MAAAVAAVDIGDIPDGVGTSGILQGAAAQGIGEALGVRGTAIERGPVVACPDGGVEVGSSFIFFLVLSFERVVRDGVEQPCAIDADSAFKTEGHLAVGCRKGCIESILGDGDFRIDKAIALAVGETVAPFVSVVKPCNVYLVLVNGRLERCHGFGLRHTGHRGLVGIGSLVVNNKQVAVCPVVGTIAFHAASVSVTWMACLARGSHIEGTQPIERRVVLGDGMFKKEFAILEGVNHAGVFDGRSGVFEG